MLCRRFQHYNSFFTTLHKSNLVAQNIQQSNQAKSATNNLDITKIYDYLRESNLEILVKTYNYKKDSSLKRCRLDLVDLCIAKTLSSIIYKHLLKTKSTILQCNPGLGLLTQELLNAGVPFIHLLEPDPVFSSKLTPLSNICKNHTTRVKLKKMNFANILLPLLKNKYETIDHLKRCLNDIGFYDLSNKNFQIIAGVVNRDFISLLLINFYEQTELFREKNPIIYFIVKPLTWWRLAYTFTNMNYYSHFSVILHLFFDIKYLGTLPRESFVPWTKDMLKNKWDESEKQLIFLKLMLKQDHKSIIRKQDLLPFTFFLKYFLRSKHLYVIKELEKFIPDCGYRLIELDINLFTTFKELTPEELLNLFKTFRSWPEYDVYYFCPDDRI